MRRILLALAVAAAFAGGVRIARGAADEDLLRKLADKEELLLKDLAKIEQACKDVLEIRKMRESGDYVLNDEEKKMERQGREDFHVFMERFRNDTLEVLEILDAAVGGKEAVDPLRRVYRKALDEVVKVNWHEEDLDVLAGELSQAYGVPINLGGDLDRRRTLTLHGQMSLLAVLLQVENVYDGKFIVRDGHLWFVRVTPAEETPPGPEKRPAIPAEDAGTKKG